jgi:F420-dependent oxidoreductase-like protein
MSLSLGVHIGQQNLSMDELRILWRRLDAAGVDWISVWDHLYEAPYQGGTESHFEALATLATLAADTQQARIGCLVFCIGYRNPALLAKAATTLDHISGGRFELGLGAGWHIWEAVAHGYPFPDIGTRLDMLEEGVEIIHQMLTQETASYSGKHYQVDDVSCFPRPQQSKLPIWIGGRGEKRTLELVARYADGWNAAYVGPDEFTHLNEVLETWCSTHDRNPAEIKRGVNVAFAMGIDQSSLAVQQKALQDSWGKAAENIREGALLCTPDAASDRILEYVESGADEINIALRAPWDDAALEVYLEEVIPKVRKFAG